MKRTYIYGAMAAGLLLAGCKSDDIPEGPGGVAEADQTFYVTLSVHGDALDGTRAAKDDGDPVAEGDFDAGENESDVNNAYFVFYDDEGNVVGSIVPVDLTLAESGTSSMPSADIAYKSVVPISVRKGENLPTQVICYINPISPSSLQTRLDVIQTVSRPSISTNDAGQEYFAMSNSVFYPEEGATEPQIAVKIPDGLLKETYEEAKEALDKNDSDNIIDVYVERYATKLKFKAVNPTDYTTASRVYTAEGSELSSVTLTFVPQYWAVNAQSEESYVIKSFREDAAGVLLPNNYTYTALDAKINEGLSEENSWQWNNAGYNRSYWGMSPAYFQSEYPEVESDLDDMDSHQKYLSYNEIKGDEDVLAQGFAVDPSKPNTYSDPHYFKETTVGSVALASNNPAAAVASVVYVGQYKLTVNGNEVVNRDFYTYLSGPVTVDGTTLERPYVYFANTANSATSDVAGGESMLKRFLAQSTILYKKEADGSFTRLSIRNSTDLTNMVAALEVTKITDDVKAYVHRTDEDGNVIEFKPQANIRTLQFKSAALASTNGIYIASGNGYKEIVADSATPTSSQIKVSEANATLMQQVGYAYYYKSGMAYFNIPVKHYGWYRKGNTQKTAKTLDWKKVMVGDFGMVRNHSYSISVSEIVGLAAGIDGPDTPIVPTKTEENYFVAYTVRILKWAVVPEQDVKL